MRIAMIGQKGLPATYGGIERHVEELGAHLAARGHHVTVYNRPHYAKPSQELYRGMHVVTLPSVATKHLDAITHTAACATHALARDYDIVHFHAAGPALLSWLPRLRGDRVVVTLHGQDWRRPKWGSLASAALRAGEWSALTLPHATISVSQTLAEKLSEKHGSEITFVPNGVTVEDQDHDDPSILPEHGIEPGRYVLFASRLVPEKGVHYLLEAWRGNGLGMPLVLAGDSSFSKTYVEQMKAQADHRSVFTGYVYGPRLAALFRNAALFVLPSDLEGMPIVLLEALGYGTPVLASDIPPNLEVLGSYGRTFRAGDVADLRLKLHEAVRDLEAMRAQAAEASRIIRRSYTWDEVTERTLDVYELVLKRRAA